MPKTNRKKLPVTVLSGFLGAGSSVGGVNGNDPNTFLWENGSENHAIPYAEVYIRVE